MNRDDVLGLARAAGFDEDRSIVGERPAQMLSRNEYVAEPVFRHEFIARHIDVLVRFADMVAVRIAAHSPPPPLVVSLSDIDQAQLAAMLAKAPAMPLVAAPDDSKLAVCFNQIKSDLIADGAVEHDLRLEFFPEAVLDAFRRQRAARQEAQQRLADAQELAAKSGLAHRKAMQAAVSEAVAAEREACAVVCEGMHEEDRPSDYAHAIRSRDAA